MLLLTDCMLVWQRATTTGALAIPSYINSDTIFGTPAGLAANPGDTWEATRFSVVTPCQ